MKKIMLLAVAALLSAGTINAASAQQEPTCKKECCKKCEASCKEKCCKEKCGKTCEEKKAVCKEPAKA